MNALTPRCYFCGGPVGESFYLLALSNNVDRVFTVDTGCVAKAGDDPHTMHVIRA